ncbi:AAA family ATPase [Pseudoxanthomonas sp. 10H]|uniref:AAA family ATPase n=1 Tax=Pseudoxanthomonas sp. 10H TaxID=3242729 RepID=UPI00355856FB
MFRRIESVSRAAVWDGYDGRTSPAPDFVRYNLIYGWNASGKTTLSRVFGLFNGLGVGRLPDGARARFSVGQEVLDTLREQDRARFPVCIFNRDFIDANLLREDYTQAPALFIVGEDNIRLSNRIAVLTRRRERVAAMYRSVQRVQAQANASREKAATDLARDCGNILGIRTFRAPDLKALAQRLDNPAKHLLDETALQAAVAQARDQSVFAQIRTPLVLLPPRLLGVEDIASLLKDTPKQNALKRLTDHPALSDWVRSGLRFHEHSTACAFCGGDATLALEDYAKHFSDEYRRQHAAITSAIGSLEQARTLPTFPHELEWTPDVREKALEAQRQYLAWEQRESEIRAVWLGQLRQKLENMETVMTVDEVEDRLSTLTAIVADLSRAKDEHNRTCEELSARRQAASNAVKEHFSARYSLDPDAVETTETLGKAGAALDRVDRVGHKIKAQMATANMELQRSSVAASQVNGHLQRLLGSRLSVEQAEDGRLQFMREGEPATNMSDGERTAISLAYFLVSLSQNGQRLEDIVVFVDDPICSLDANHIYDVASLLITTLKACRQVFISTHNSEFFNTIKQEWTDRGSFRSGHAGFLVQRGNDGSSQLVPLPKHLTKFRSDYHHVFYCLRQIQANGSQDIEAYLHCPNLLRRFLEMYLGFRKPAAAGYQSKLDVLFDDDAVRGAVARYVDEGSHSQSTLRLLEVSDFPAMSRKMVERVMSALASKDPLHHAALMEATE